MKTKYRIIGMYKNMSYTEYYIKAETMADATMIARGLLYTSNMVHVRISNKEYGTIAEYNKR